MKQMIFLCFLILAAYQDLKTKSIESRLFWLFGFLGAGICLIEKRSLSEVAVSCGIGVVLLLVSRWTQGGIGEGDGWFFVVSGLYLPKRANGALFLCGLSLCFLVSLPLAVMSVIRHGNGRKRSLPFLPFLLLPGIWLGVAAFPNG